MIYDVFIVINTRKISKQLNFYKNILGLELIFEHEDSYGLGKNNDVLIILRNDEDKNSHHLAEQKGPQIITFKCDGDINHYKNILTNANFHVRDTLSLPDHNSQYLFIEDVDGNEICLNFTA